MARSKEYPDELVQRGVRLVLESGRPIAHIASDLGMHAETLRKKVRQDSRPQRRAPDKSFRGRGRPAEPLDSDFTGIVPGVVPSPSPDGLEWLNHAEPARLRASLENRCSGNPATEGSNPSPSAQGGDSPASKHQRREDDVVQQGTVSLRWIHHVEQRAPQHTPVIS